MRGAGWLALALGLGLIGCQAPSMRKTSAPPVGDGNPHQEITALWTQIRQWRLDADLGVEPELETVARMSALPATEAAATCAAPAPTIGTCRDACDLGRAICDNALAICRIADELVGDVWAHGKCDSAKASCHEAEARCCECRGRLTVGSP